MRKYRPRKNNTSKNTSWQNVNKWYSDKVGEKGHYFQENIILPRIVEYIGNGKENKVIDIGCGEGILSRELKMYYEYVGVDLSKGLIESANDRNENERASFIHLDAGKKFEIKNNYFTHASIMLALQNIENMDVVFNNVFNALETGGKMYIVINHPHYRIPKSSSWEIDKELRRQYRRIFRYLSPHKIRIDMTPGSRRDKEYTYSFHRSLNDISHSLKDNGFYIDFIEEWNSNKKSEGTYSDMENFARDEIPMFMCICAIKR